MTRLLATEQGQRLAALIVRRAADRVSSSGLDISTVIDVVSLETGVAREEILGRSRVGAVARARMVVAHVAFESAVATQPEIGDVLGRHPTTILAARRSVRRRIKAGDQGLADLCARVSARLYSTP
jgi:chromosomal replication initiation ATPase DnaA